MPDMDLSTARVLYFSFITRRVGIGLFLSALAWLAISRTWLAVVPTVLGITGWVVVAGSFAVLIPLLLSDGRGLFGADLGGYVSRDAYRAAKSRLRRVTD